MTTVHDYLRKWLLDSSGVNGWLAQALTNWDPEFVALMRARMVQGFARYGSIRDPALRGKWDNIGSAIERLKTYLKDGNKEHLADVANLLMCEHRTESCHPSPEFRSTDDELHTEELTKPALRWECGDCGEVWADLREHDQPKGTCPKCGSRFARFTGRVE